MKAFCGFWRPKAREGVGVRLALADLGSRQVAGRGDEEGISQAMPIEIRTALALFQRVIARLEWND